MMLHPGVTYVFISIFFLKTSLFVQKAYYELFTTCAASIVELMVSMAILTLIITWYILPVSVVQPYQKFARQLYNNLGWSRLKY